MTAQSKLAREMPCTRASLVFIIGLFRCHAAMSEDELIGKCPYPSITVHDSNGKSVCACSGKTSICVPGDIKCVTARNHDVPVEILRHSEMIRQEWPLPITNKTFLLPFPGKMQGFRPRCTGCRCASPCTNVVFVVGCGHSGTTYLTRLIGAHPKYSSIMAETGWFSTYGGTRVAFESFRKESAACGRDNGKRVLVEKTPKHVLALEKLWRYFPQGKVVLIYRDGRDVTLSLAKRYRYSKENRFGMCMAATRWVVDNRAADPWLNDTRLYSLRYEDLVGDPHGTMDRLFLFLENTKAPLEVHGQFDRRGNLTWGRLEPVQNQPKEPPKGGPAAMLVNKHLRNWQVNQPLYDARGKWGKEFTDDQLKGLYKCHGFTRLMIDLDYFDKNNETQWYDRSARHHHS